MSKCMSETCGCRAVDEGLRGDKTRALGKWPEEAEAAQYERLKRLIKAGPDCNFTFAPGSTIEVSISTPRKDYPLGTGCLDYFPLALLAVANCSKVGNDQHNPGEPLHWAREKSTDEADALQRHFLERGKIDTDGVRHSAKLAWRSLALLEKELEAAGFKIP